MSEGGREGGWKRVTESLFVSILCIYNHKVRGYFAYKGGHGLGSLAIHLAHHCFSFNMRWI